MSDERQPDADDAAAISAEIYDAAVANDNAKLLAIIAHLTLALYQRVARIEREYLRK